jgi:hypothetical protein
MIDVCRSLRPEIIVVRSIAFEIAIGFLPDICHAKRSPTAAIEAQAHYSFASPSR